MTTDIENGVYDSDNGGFSVELDGDGTFNKVTLKESCAHAIFLGRTDTDNYTQFQDQTEFQFSFNSDGSSWMSFSKFQVSPAQSKFPFVCYVKSAVGTSVIILGLNK
jgi:hypothetical protein